MEDRCYPSPVPEELPLGAAPEGTFDLIKVNPLSDFEYEERVNLGPCLGFHFRVAVSLPVLVRRSASRCGE